MKTDTTLLNSDQLHALLNYVEKYGDSWRRQLLDDWRTGKDIGPELRQIRNQFGPSWVNALPEDFISEGDHD